MPVSKRDQERRKITYTTSKDRAESHAKGFTPTAFKVPEGYEQFRFTKEKTYRLVHLPSLVGSGHNPHATAAAHYECTYFVHTYIGPNREFIPCNARNKRGDGRCPICEEAKRLADDPNVDKKKIKVWPKERQLWWVINLDEEDKGPQLFEAAYRGGPDSIGYGVGIDKEVDAMIKADDPRADFWQLDPKEGGCVIHVRTEEDAYEGKTFFKPTKIDFVPRKKAYPESIMDDLPPLDELVLEADYDKAKNALRGVPDEGEEAPEEDAPPRGKPSKNGSPKVRAKAEEVEEESAPEDEPEETQEEEQTEEVTAEEKGIEVGTTVRHEKHGDCEVIHMSKDGLNLRLKDADGEIYRGVMPSECDVVTEDEDVPPEDDDEPEEAPTTKKGGKTTKAPPKKGKKVVEEEESEEDDVIPFDDDDEPPPTKKGNR